MSDRSLTQVTLQWMQSNLNLFQCKLQEDASVLVDSTAKDDCQIDASMLPE